MKKNILVVGLGYLGLVQSVYLAKLGYRVFLYDIDTLKLHQIKAKKIPFKEPDLDHYFSTLFNNFEFVKKHSFLKSLEKCDGVFICISTPYDPATNELSIDGIITLLKTLDKIGYSGDIICRSTLKPLNAFEERLFSRLRVVISPEFLTEGMAVKNMFFPQRVVLGFSKDDTEKISKINQTIESYFSDIERNKCIATDYTSSILIKLSANSFLATKVSFINMISMLVQKIGGNIHDISRALSLDTRIGSYLRAGIGYGGGCLPKDTLQLEKTISDAVKLEKGNMLTPVTYVNTTIEKCFVDYLIEHFYPLDRLAIGIMGVAFKEGTDDLRESKAISILKKLIELNVKAIYWYDPLYHSPIQQTHMVEDIDKLVESSDLLLLLTPSKEFIDYRCKKFFNNGEKSIVDSHNLLKQSHWPGWNFYRYGVHLS